MTTTIEIVLFVLPTLLFVIGLSLICLFNRKYKCFVATMGVILIVLNFVLPVQPAWNRGACFGLGAGMLIVAGMMGETPMQVRKRLIASNQAQTKN